MSLAATRIMTNGGRSFRPRIYVPLTEKQKELVAWKNEYARTTVLGYTKIPDGPLSERGKVLQQIILARDYEILFSIIPQKEWGHSWQLGKYSFVDRNGRREYVPFTENDISRFVRSPFWTVETGYECPEPQYVDQIRRHWEKTQRTVAKFPKTDWRYIWPIFPGRIGCQIYRPSGWVKIRSKVYVAVAVVAAVYLGPIVLEKVSGMLAQGASGAGATAAETSSFVAKINEAVTVYNKVNSVAHIVQGKIPPPPIGISGATFRTVVFNAVKEEIKKAAINEAMEQGIEYVQKKMTEKEEAKIRAEIALLQQEMEKLIPKDTPIMPSPELPESDREKIREIQLIQAKREQNQVAMLALAAGAGLFLLAG